MKTFRPPEYPWIPPDLERADIFALKAIYAGKANEGQQVRALDVVINKLCGTYDMSFRPGGAESSRATDFAEGKRFVGTLIVNALKTILPESGEQTDGGRKPRPRPRRPGTGKPGKPGQ